MEYLDLTLINTLLNNLNVQKYNIYFFDTIDSTNSYALENIKNFKNDTISIILTEHQTIGRGRFNRKWTSKKFFGLTFSLVYKIPNIDLRTFPLLIAVAVSEMLSYFNNINFIKWPNDIYVDGKKCAGILIENRISNKENNIVIGIGINESIKISRNYLLCYTIYYCSYLINEYLNSGFVNIKNRWLAKCIHLNHMVSLYKEGNKITSGINVGINNNGGLLIRDDNNHIKEYYDTSISLRF